LPPDSGFHTEEILEIIKSASKSSKIAAVDVSDYNPFVEDQSTGRFLATLFYYFALGLSERLA